ncbi:hypothetical protein P368_01395 [Comamonas thiooxydans]|nr:hypothetical protein CTATCC11996_01110 [Comamonas testosteroni ATCC 11996]KGG87358.1 hypothetical protein P609_08890 [Comamonas thiooxydans]KGG96071.1 hypothetical protein P369_01390 [Comamonas thiooxydans]KGH02511.1 hypothetical protein P367_01390 [Comamonas thiooxydans]KGH09725.1 hypothetical protein P365_01395 [Comamonas thiooxydans]
MNESNRIHRTEYSAVFAAVQHVSLLTLPCVGGDGFT